MKKILYSLIIASALIPYTNNASMAGSTLRKIDTAVGVTFLIAPLIASPIAGKFMAKQYKEFPSPAIAESMYEMLHNLCEKIGIDPTTIELKFTPQLPSWSPASAKPSLFWGKSIVILTHQFIKLPLDQQEAILAHELCHIKHKDSHIQAALLYGIPACGVALCLGAAYALNKGGSFLQTTASQHKWNTSARTIGTLTAGTVTLLKSHIFQLFATFFHTGTNTHYIYDKTGECIGRDITFSASPLMRLRSKIIRAREKYADIDAALLAGTAQGAINNLESKINLDLSTPLDDHPAAKERIKYLKPYVVEKGHHE